MKDAIMRALHAHERVVRAEISPMPKAFGDSMPKVTVHTETGAVIDLFAYYPDELSFTEQDFIGLTVLQAGHLKYERDRTYLRSGR